MSSGVTSRGPLAASSPLVELVPARLGLLSDFAGPLVVLGRGRLVALAREPP
jgi:hypothetical protein